MIAAKFTLLNPDALEAEMAIRMSVGDWKKFAGLLEVGTSRYEYPASKVLECVRQLVRDAEANFSREDREDNTQKRRI